MRARGRPVLGGVAGLLLGLFLGLDLLLVGAVRLDSPVLTVLPVLGLAAGIWVGVRAPFRHRRARVRRPDIVPPEAAAEAATGTRPSAPKPPPSALRTEVDRDEDRGADPSEED